MFQGGSVRCPCPALRTEFGTQFSPWEILSFPKWILALRILSFKAANSHFGEFYPRLEAPQVAPVRLFPPGQQVVPTVDPFAV